jgi:Lrp/AsnC family transcriptional regulator, leucine-responsive regulatory protein
MATESLVLDDIDRVIVRSLRLEGRISWRELGDRVHLSATSVAERVKRLERVGVISGYSAVIDSASLGRDLRAVVQRSCPRTSKRRSANEPR